MSEDCSEGESIDVENRAIRRARKQHKCSACKRTIDPGELYAYVFIAGRGFGHETFRRCGACEKTWQHLRDNCRFYNMKNAAERDYEVLYPREDLGCGLKYESEWGALPDDIAALAFMTNAEASALLEARR